MLEVKTTGIRDTGKSIIGFVDNWEVITVYYEIRLRVTNSTTLPRDIHRAHKEALIMVEAIETAMRRYEEEENDDPQTTE